MTLLLPTKRKKNLLKDLTSMLKNTFWPAKIIRSIAGRMTSTFQAFVPAKILTRNLLRCLPRNPTEQGMVTLPPAAIQDIMTFIQMLQSWSGEWSVEQTKMHYLLPDASQTGWGAILMNQEQEVTATIAGH